MEEEKKTVRCCSECKTTKTPMWRGGPSCPKFSFLLFAVEFTVTLQCMWDQIKETKTVRVIGYSYYSQPQSLQEDKSITTSLSFSHGGVFLKKRRILKEEEQAALCLLLLSRNSAFA
ncbi:hypothetical protein DY000_02025944 [Brassica cretica]|uniref:GATA-type domain-containing protein n=1 Tax=Brassica cretica TaxID=69181 RepID=A0ABQ7EIY7_BRACR|nr:hypothetical protein DY000_02025944 [Brassica cretica]